jgi:BirA family biotin operon repressor/biotin-[acetyl-CoA-carboxylase] ligase
MFSTILYPPLPADWLGLITLATGVAVVETILTCAPPLQPSIKWPNDVLINERKCCGILLESSFAHGSTMRRIVILGIGLNVNQIDFPPSLAETATSMRLEAGHVIPRTHVFATLLDQLEMHYESLLQDSGESIRRAYRSYLKGIGLPVSIRLLAQKQEVYGILRGIDEQGALLLDVNGLVQPYYAGDVTFILR